MESYELAEEALALARRMERRPGYGSVTIERLVEVLEVLASLLAEGAEK